MRDGVVSHRFVKSESRLWEQAGRQAGRQGKRGRRMQRILHVCSYVLVGTHRRCKDNVTYCFGGAAIIVVLGRFAGLCTSRFTSDQLKCIHK
jgi:hypothetical protein